MAGDRRSTRLGVLGAVSLLLLGALGARLWFLQVVDSAGAQEAVTANRTRTVQLAPERGRVFDADGRIVADNKRVLTVAVDWAVIKKADSRAALFARLSGPLNTPVEEFERRYNAGFYSPLLPLPLADDIDEQTAQFLTERIEDYPGVTIEENWERRYPYAPLASHVVGFMGAITKDEVDEYTALGYQQSERVGQFGVEKSFESVLRGTPGYAVYEVRASGAIVREIERVEPITGQDVRLTIDLDLQQLAEQALQTQLAERRLVSVRQLVDKGQPIKPNFPAESFFKAPAGSVIVENYQTGAILAMASYPTFDNRWFDSGASGDKLAQVFPTYQTGPDGKPLLDADGEPVPLDPGDATLVNRAIQGQYNVGSTFKPFVAWSALNAPGDVLPGGANFVYQDRGSYKLESIGSDVCAQGVRCEFRNSVDAQGLPSQYGDVRLQDALAVSSDAYFYRIGELIFTKNGGQPVLQEELRKFGFGAKTGIDLPYEYAGRVPDKESKKALYDKGVLAASESPNYLVGDNVQLAIGQGLLAVTPLQLATAYSTLANAGTVLKPHIALQILAPGTPDSPTQAGWADLSKSTVVRSFEVAEPARDLVPMPEDTVRGPIIAGMTRVIKGPGVYFPANRYRSPTGDSVFGGGLYDWDSFPIAGKTGTAQGAASLPWNDSSAFTGISLDASRPYTVTAYLEKSGYGAQAAAPVAKCMFLGIEAKVPLQPVQLSDELDITQTVAAQPTTLASDDCLRTKNTGKPVAGQEGRD
jgi:penicillin-binding protein 2